MSYKNCTNKMNLMELRKKYFKIRTVFYLALAGKGNKYYREKQNFWTNVGQFTTPIFLGIVAAFLLVFFYRLCLLSRFSIFSRITRKFYETSRNQEDYFYHIPGSHQNYQPDFKTRFFLRCLYPFTGKLNLCSWFFKDRVSRRTNEIDSISGLIERVERKIDRSSEAKFNRAFCQQPTHQHNNAQETCLFCVINHQNSGKKRNGQLPDEKMASKRIRRKSLLAATGNCQKITSNNDCTDEKEKPKRDSCRDSKEGFGLKDDFDRLTLENSINNANL